MKEQQTVKPETSGIFKTFSARKQKQNVQLNVSCIPISSPDCNVTSTGSSKLSLQD